MYSPLAPDPLPAGPRVTNPLAPVLRLLLRVFNVALAALGLLLIAAALWMGQQYRHGGGGGGGGGGGDAPAPAVTLAFAASSGVALATDTGAAAGAAAAAAAAAAASFPWFIYVVGATGAYCLLTALCGLGGANRDRRLQLASYIFFLALLALAEAGATLLLLTDNAWKDSIPDDPSGRWRQAQDWVAANARAARLVAVGTLGAELAALAAACWLHSLYQAAYFQWVDDREEQSERARELLARTVVQSYAGGSGSSWSARLRQKYGVEASALEATTVAARQTAALQEDMP